MRVSYAYFIFESYVRILTYYILSYAYDRALLFCDKKFPDISLTFSNIPHISLTAVKFRDISIFFQTGFFSTFKICDRWKDRVTGR